MLIVAGSMELDPSDRDEFLAGAVAGMTASRAEPGCLDYVLSADPVDPGRVRLFERWETKDALAAHLATQAERRTQSPPAVAVKAVDILQYEVGAAGPLGS